MMQLTRILTNKIQAAVVQSLFELNVEMTITMTIFSLTEPKFDTSITKITWKNHFAQPEKNAGMHFARFGPGLFRSQVILICGSFWP